ncbi:MAG TPA: hypothetical protein P5556_07015 [Candidatus Gastranaerophilales bacterium]|nr:hypothetical protein [Candidatus Gastranaerophilales bacterium]
MNLINLALNIKRTVLLALIIVGVNINNAYAKGLYADIMLDESLKKQEFTHEKGVIKGNISVVDDFPEEFYGTWSVLSVLEETNNPDLFRMRSSDIWTFERKGDIITLSNPVSGATASITINEVIDKTAIFTRKDEDENTVETETPQITVEESAFSGTDVIIIEHYRNGKKIKSDRVKYKIRGYLLNDNANINKLFAK